MDQMTAPAGDAPDRGTGPQGVGVAYHPLLHDALLAARDAYDFIELPLDRYLDEAQRALLDPRLARVRSLAAAKPCVWRSGPAAPPRDASAARRIAALVRETGATLWRDDASNPSTPEVGVSRVRTLPLAAAIGPDEAERASLPRGPRTLVARPERMTHPFGDVGPQSSRFCTDSEQSGGGSAEGVGAVGIEIGATDLPCDPESAFRTLVRLPPGCVVDVALDTQDGRAWPLLRAVLSGTGARRVIVRRTRRLFPLSAFFADLSRARAALAEAPAVEVPPGEPAAGGPAAAWDVPSVPAALNAEARRVWREGVAAVHAARQLAQWMERRPTGRVAR